MTVAELIRELETYPVDAIVTSATIRIKIGRRRSTLIVRKPPKVDEDSQMKAAML